MRKTLMVWLLGVAATAGGIALADDESDRRELIEDIDDKVDDIGDEL